MSFLLHSAVPRRVTPSVCPIIVSYLHTPKRCSHPPETSYSCISLTSTYLGAVWTEHAPGRDQVSGMIPRFWRELIHVADQGFYALFEIGLESQSFRDFFAECCPAAGGACNSWRRKYHQTRRFPDLSHAATQSLTCHRAAYRVSQRLCLRNEGRVTDTVSPPELLLFAAGPGSASDLAPLLRE
jgi:hypothetical protein